MVVFVQMSRIMSGSCAFVTRCRAHVIGLYISYLTLLYVLQYRLARCLADLNICYFSRTIVNPVIQAFIYLAKVCFVMFLECLYSAPVWEYQPNRNRACMYLGLSRAFDFAANGLELLII